MRFFANIGNSFSNRGSLGWSSGGRASSKVWFGNLSTFQRSARFDMFQKSETSVLRHQHIRSGFESIWDLKFLSQINEKLN